VFTGRDWFMSKQKNIKDALLIAVTTLIKSEFYKRSFQLQHCDNNCRGIQNLFFIKKRKEK